MIALHKIIGPNYSTITGDQSLTEVISKGGEFSYLSLGARHKNDLLNQLMILSQNNELAKVINGYLLPHGTKMPNPYDLKDSFIKFCKLIREQHNLGNVIISHLEQSLNCSLIKKFKLK